MKYLALILCLIAAPVFAGEQVGVGTLAIQSDATPDGWVDAGSPIPCMVYRELCRALYPDKAANEIDVSKDLPPIAIGQHWILKAY